MKISFTVYGHSAENMSVLADKSIDFICFAPALWQYRDYGSDLRGLAEDSQLGSVEDYSTFMKRLKIIFTECYRVAKEGCICCVVTGDLYKGNRTSIHEVVPYHAEVMHLLGTIGFRLRQIGIIKRYVTKKRDFYPFDYDEEGKHTHMIVSRHRYILVVSKGEDASPAKTQRGLSEGYWEPIVSIPSGEKLFGSRLLYAGVTTLLDSRHMRRLIPKKILDLRRTLVKRREAAYDGMTPLESVRILFKRFTHPGMCVLDPFLGSGTTFEVCREYGCTGIGFEVSEKALEILKTGFATDELKIVDEDK
jgi:hypothetical protein